MEYELVTLKPKIIAGLSARTSNHAPDMPMVIGGLWRKFYEEGVYAQIPGKVGKSAIGLYSDYEDGVNGFYDITVGCEISARGPLPEGVVLKSIPGGRYAKYKAPGGTPQAVGACWEAIWKMPLDRRFTGDFEEYADGPGGDVFLYVALADRP